MKKKTILNKENIIGFCSVLLLIFSLLFLMQQFIGCSFGAFYIGLTGYETIFGAKKQIMLDVNLYEDVVFKVSPLILIFFIFLVAGTILSALCFVLRLIGKGSKRTILILNTVAGLTLLIVGISMFFFGTFFDLTNKNLGYSDFRIVGVTTPSICVLVDSLITLLNSIDIFHLKKAS